MTIKKLNSKLLEKSLLEFSTIGDIYNEHIKKINEDIYFCEQTLSKYPIYYFELKIPEGCLNYNNGKIVLKTIEAQTNSVEYNKLIDLKLELKLKLFFYLPTLLEIGINELNQQIKNINIIHEDFQNDLKKI